MWIALRAVLGAAARAVIQALWVWIQSEAARFTAEYISRAKPIVKQVALRGDLTGEQKAKMAADMLKQELKLMGKEYKDSWINTTIEIAYGAVKKEMGKDK